MAWSRQTGSGKHHHRQTPPKPEEDDTKRRIEYAVGLWRNATPLSGTLGEQYFIEQRKLDVRQFDLRHCLRWNENARTIIALMRHPMTDTPCGIHRTFLNEDGTKRERKMLGKQGMVKLTPDEEVTLGIGITEGVEDGLAVLLSGWAPIWAATSAGSLAKFPIFHGIESLTIFPTPIQPALRLHRSALTAGFLQGERPAFHT